MGLAASVCAVGISRSWRHGGGRGGGPAIGTPPLSTATIFDADLVRRYDRPGPRYTSYPTAVQFHTGFGAAEYEAAARASNAGNLKPLSVYVHWPFCESPSFYWGCNKVITRDHARAQPYLEHLGREIERQGALFDRTRPV